mmetsp:Transcript_71746/g.198037  ORF Transcript_71746/g.198037 Transcript_71746/m.198037 type:complete len:117 (+) Transcript_71746:54-404(+)
MPMARSSSRLAPVAMCAATLMLLVCAAPAFIAPARGAAPGADAEADLRVGAVAFAGLAPLAVEQPAVAYDSVVAMLQSWLVGGTVLVLIFAAALVAATANPLTKRRTEVAAAVEKN